MRRDTSFVTLLAASFLLVGCPPPSAARFLVIHGDPPIGSTALFREFSRRVAQSLGRPATSHESPRWSCRAFSLAPPRMIHGPRVTLYLHKPTGQVFAAIQEHKGSDHLSAEAREVLRQIRGILESAAAPARVRDTGDFGEVIQRAGEDVYSRCHEQA